MDIQKYLNDKEMPERDTIVKDQGLSAKVKSFSGDLIDQILIAAIDPHRPLVASQLQAIEFLWPLVLKVMDKESVAPMLDLYGKTTEEQVEVILTAVSTGVIEFEDAKKYLELLNNGAELTDLKELMLKLEEMKEQGLLGN